MISGPASQPPHAASAGVILPNLQLHPSQNPPAGIGTPQLLKLMTLVLDLPRKLGACTGTESVDSLHVAGSRNPSTAHYSHALMATILLNIGTLALRSMAKPLSGHFTKYVMGQPMARDYVIAMSQVRPALL